LITEYGRDIAVNHREAREEGKLIIAKNLLSEGFTSEFVHEITRLSLERIKTL